MGIGTIKKNKYMQSIEQAELELEIRGLRFRGDTTGKAVNQNDIEVVDTVTISIKRFCFLYIREHSFKLLVNTKNGEQYLEAKNRFVIAQEFISPALVIENLIHTERDISDYTEEYNTSFVPILPFKISNNKSNKEYCLGYIDRGEGYCPGFALSHSDGNLYSELSATSAFEIICMVAHSQQTFWWVANVIKSTSMGDYGALLQYTVNRAK